MKYPWSGGRAIAQSPLGCLDEFVLAHQGTACYFSIVRSSSLDLFGLSGDNPTIEAEVVRQFEALERSKRVDVEVLLSRSTDRLSRQTEIRRMIADTKDRPNVSALAREFRVARRTIIRDLQELIRRGELKPEVYPKWENPDASDE